MSAETKVRIALVVTRSWDEKSTFGRERTLREIAAALGANYDTTIFRLHNLLETRRIKDLAGAATQWLSSIARGAPLPLQNAFYSGSTEIEQLVEALRAGNFQAIYIDSVRSQILVRALRKALPHARIVVDFDDLMSRRMQHLTELRLPVSLGFLQHLFPKALRWSVEGPLSSLLTRYEAAALSQAEREIVGSAQSVVLVSGTERDVLQRGLPAQLRDRVHAVPPPAASYRSAQPSVGPYRFIFTGSDKLVQNRLSIDALLELWMQLRPSSELHVYGRQQRPDRPVANVHWHGFVENIEEAYVPGSIMLLPAILAGGIKTKVIEAWSYGCPVLGNPTAFEGLHVPNYPLVLPQSEWTSYLWDPAAHASAWSAAARIGNAFVKDALSRERFAAHWRDLLMPQAVAPEVPVTT